MKRKESPILLHKWYHHIDKFRKGNFNVAEEDVKIAWITFVDNILGKLSKSWRDDKVKSNKNLSLHITPSDEAYAMLISNKRMEYWVTLNKSVKGSKRKSVPSMITNQDDNNEDDEMNVASGSATPEFHAEVDQYYDYFESIQKKRKTEDEGLSWEIGFREAITVKSASLPSTESLEDSFYDANTETEHVGHHGGKLRNISFETNW